MGKPEVSIIVPVFNVRDYIGECVRSLKGQTFEDFEVVLVDDGSDDGSLDEALRVADGDARFRGVRQDNVGPATARNRGFEESRGRFVMFMDPDDWLLPETVGLLHSTACENDLDYLDFTAHTFYESTASRQARNEDWYEARRDIPGVMTGPELFERYMDNGEYSCSTCFHFFRRELMADSGLRLADGMYVHEDELFSPQLIVQAKRAMFLNLPLYQRRVRGSSLMTGGRSMRNVASMFQAYRGLEAWLVENGRNYDEALVGAMTARVEELRGLAARDAAQVPEQELEDFCDTLEGADRGAFCEFLEVVSEERAANASSLARAVAAARGWASDLLVRRRASAKHRAFEEARRQSGVAGPAVSVLVPIYNAEPYLRQCLEALVGQTLRELEIICINDGSTDGSAAIIDEYAARDGRIRVITKANSGYGDSMNRGLSEARGEYIGIVEPDDFPDLVMFEKLYSAAKKYDCDLVKCNHFIRTGNRDSMVNNFRGFPCGTLLRPVENPSLICTIPAIWTALYRKEMLDREGIRFRPTPGAAFQDTSFTMRAWFAADTCTLLRRPLLHYRVDNPGASSHTTDRVYVVCDELACSEEFLRGKPDRVEAFLPWFLLDKWGKYCWNYRRIDPSLHHEFAERLREEFLAASEAGELDLGIFPEASRSKVEFLLNEGAAAFAERFPEGYEHDWRR
mgnify:CR=1 FL=1